MGQTVLAVLKSKLSHVIHAVPTPSHREAMHSPLFARKHVAPISAPRHSLCEWPCRTALACMHGPLPARMCGRCLHGGTPAGRGAPDGRLLRNAALLWCG